MAIPVVSCGVSKLVGGRIAPKLLPEVEVIQFITSVQRAKTEISLLLSGGSPDPDPDNVGTHNFSSPPKAVLFGRGFTPENVEEIRQACGGQASNVAWLQGKVNFAAGDSQLKPPNVNDPASLDAYAAKTAEEVKSVLLELKASGALGKDGVHMY